MGKFLNFVSRKVQSMLGTSHIKYLRDDVASMRRIVENTLVDDYLKRNLFENEAYLKSRKITHFHKSVFTQNGEDGIIEEIFDRIGVTNQYFVEFGVHGVKNNSTYLLVKNWRGLWIGGREETRKNIERKFGHSISTGNLMYAVRWITRENIEQIFQEHNVPQHFDFLSIDIDGNDYWIWQAIENYSPRVVCIEYNATYPADVSWVMAYNAEHTWDGSSYFGAYLRALEELGRRKGYALVGCDFTGCNAFFVRATENLEAFESPFTAAHHYEPPRYFLSRSSGHRQGFGPFETDV